MVITHPRSPVVSIAAKQALWTPSYAAVERILDLTTAGLLVPIGDPNDEPSDPTTVTTRGAEQVVFTYTNSGRHLWSTLLGYEGPGQVPVLYFDGSTDWLETPDAAFWNDSAGASEPSYFWSCWVNVVAGVAQNALWAKTNTFAGSGQDWGSVIFTDETFSLRIFDDSAGAFIGSTTGALGNGWHYLAITKHDDGVDSASVITYVDGVVDRADDTSGSYVQQEDGTGVVRIGSESDGGSQNSNSIAGGPLGPVFIPVGTGTVPTANQILALYQSGRRMLEYS